MYVIAVIAGFYFMDKEAMSIQKLIDTISSLETTSMSHIILYHIIMDRKYSE